MIGLPTNTLVWIAAGNADMRKGFHGLADLVQTALEGNPYCGHHHRGCGDRSRPGCEANG